MHAKDKISTRYLSPSEPTRAGSSSYDARTIATGFDETSRIHDASRLFRIRWAKAGKSLKTGHWEREWKWEEGREKVKGWMDGMIRLEHDYKR